ncbi:MAG: hypothetical protein IPJ94_19575 [Chloroflexi bacterium]|nr:hypothetical protein [Chloroflexota bacterium]
MVVDPAGQYGGYQTTFPKGTQEDGMSLQATAVKEVYERRALRRASSVTWATTKKRPA